MGDSPTSETTTEKPEQQSQAGSDRAGDNASREANPAPGTPQAPVEQYPHKTADVPPLEISNNGQQTPGQPPTDQAQQPGDPQKPGQPNTDQAQQPGAPQKPGQSATDQAPQPGAPQKPGQPATDQAPQPGAPQKPGQPATDQAPQPGAPQKSGQPATDQAPQPGAPQTPGQPPTDQAPPPGTPATKPLSTEELDQRAKDLRDAVTGKDPDSEKAQNLLTGLSQADREALSKQYDGSNPDGLSNDLKDKFSGVDKAKLENIWNKPDDRPNYAGDVNVLLYGDKNTASPAVVDYLSTLNAQQTQQLKDDYQKQYGQSFEDAIKKESHDPDKDFGGHVDDTVKNNLDLLLKGSDKRTAEDNVSMAHNAVKDDSETGVHLLSAVVGNDTEPAKAAREQLKNDSQFQTQLNDTYKDNDKNLGIAKDLVERGSSMAYVLGQEKIKPADVETAVKNASEDDRRLFQQGQILAAGGQAPENDADRKALDFYKQIDKNLRDVNVNTDEKGDKKAPDGKQIVQWEDKLDGKGGTIIGDIAANSQDLASMTAVVSNMTEEQWNILKNPETGPSFNQVLQAQIGQFTNPAQKAEIAKLIEQKTQASDYATSQTISESFASSVAADNSPGNIASSILHLNAEEADQYKNDPQFKAQLDGAADKLTDVDKAIGQRSLTLIGESGKPIDPTKPDPILTALSDLKTPEDIPQGKKIEDVQKALALDPTILKAVQEGGSGNATAEALIKLASKSVGEEDARAILKDGHLALNKQWDYGVDKSYVMSQLPATKQDEKDSFLGHLNKDERQVAENVLKHPDTIKDGQISLADQARLVAIGSNKDTSSLLTQLQQVSGDDKIKIFNDYQQSYHGTLAADVLPHVDKADKINFQDALSLTKVDAQTDLGKHLAEGDDFSGKTGDNTGLSAFQNVEQFSQVLTDTNANYKDLFQALSPDQLQSINSSLAQAKEQFSSAREQYEKDHEGFFSWDNMKHVAVDIAITTAVCAVAATTGGVGGIALGALLYGVLEQGKGKLLDHQDISLKGFLTDVAAGVVVVGTAGGLGKAAQFIGGKAAATIIGDTAKTSADSTIKIAAEQTGKEIGDAGQAVSKAISDAYVQAATMPAKQGEKFLSSLPETLSQKFAGKVDAELLNGITKSLPDLKQFTSSISTIAQTSAVGTRMLTENAVFTASNLGISPALTVIENNPWGDGQQKWSGWSGLVDSAETGFKSAISKEALMQSFGIGTGQMLGVRAAAHIRSGDPTFLQRNLTNIRRYPGFGDNWGFHKLEPTREQQIAVPVTPKSQTKSETEKTNTENGSGKERQEVRENSQPASAKTPEADATTNNSRSNASETPRLSAEETKNPTTSRTSNESSATSTRATETASAEHNIEVPANTNRTGTNKTTDTNRAIDTSKTTDANRTVDSNKTSEGSAASHESRRDVQETPDSNTRATAAHEAEQAMLAHFELVSENVANRATQNVRLDSAAQSANSESNTAAATAGQHLSAAARSAGEASTKPVEAAGASQSSSKTQASAQESNVGTRAEQIQSVSRQTEQIAAAAAKTTGATGEATGSVGPTTKSNQSKESADQSNIDGPTSKSGNTQKPTEGVAAAQALEHVLSGKPASEAATSDKAEPTRVTEQNKPIEVSVAPRKKGAEKSEDKNSTTQNQSSDHKVDTKPATTDLKDKSEAAEKTATSGQQAGALLAHMASTTNESVVPVAAKLPAAKAGAAKTEFTTAQSKDAAIVPGASTPSTSVPVARAGSVERTDTSIPIARTGSIDRTAARNSDITNGSNKPPLTGKSTTQDVPSQPKPIQTKMQADQGKPPSSGNRQHERTEDRLPKDSSVEQTAESISGEEAAIQIPRQRRHRLIQDPLTEIAGGRSSEDNTTTQTTANTPAHATAKTGASTNTQQPQSTHNTPPTNTDLQAAHNIIENPNDALVKSTRQSADLETARVDSLKRAAGIKWWDLPAVRRNKFERLLQDMPLRVIDSNSSLRPIMHDGNHRLFYARKLGIAENRILLADFTTGKPQLKTDGTPRTLADLRADTLAKAKRILEPKIDNSGTNKAALISSAADFRTASTDKRASDLATLSKPEAKLHYESAKPVNNSNRWTQRSEEIKSRLRELLNLPLTLEGPVSGGGSGHDIRWGHLTRPDGTKLRVVIHMRDNDVRRQFSQTPADPHNRVRKELAAQNISAKLFGTYPATLKRVIDIDGQPTKVWLQDASGESFSDCVAQKAKNELTTFEQLFADDPELRNELELTLVERSIIGDSDIRDANISYEDTPQGIRLHNFDTDLAFQNLDNIVAWIKMPNEFKIATAMRQLSLQPLKDSTINQIEAFLNRYTQPTGRAQLKDFGLHDAEIDGVLTRAQWFITHKTFPPLISEFNFQQHIIRPPATAEKTAQPSSAADFRTAMQTLVNEAKLGKAVTFDIDTTMSMIDAHGKPTEHTQAELLFQELQNAFPENSFVFSKPNYNPGDQGYSEIPAPDITADGWIISTKENQITTVNDISLAGTTIPAGSKFAVGTILEGNKVRSADPEGKVWAVSPEGKYIQIAEQGKAVTVPADALSTEPTKMGQVVTAKTDDGSQNHIVVRTTKETDPDGNPLLDAYPTGGKNFEAGYKPGTKPGYWATKPKQEPHFKLPDHITILTKTAWGDVTASGANHDYFVKSGFADAMDAAATNYTGVTDPRSAQEILRIREILGLNTPTQVEAGLRAKTHEDVLELSAPEGGYGEPSFGPSSSVRQRLKRWFKDSPADLSDRIGRVPGERINPSLVGTDSLYRIGDQSVLLHIGQEIPIGRGRFGIADSSSYVSRNHAVIGRDQSGFYVAENPAKPSANGTFVNGVQRVQPGQKFYLRPGDYLNLGRNNPFALGKITSLMRLPADYVPPKIATDQSNYYAKNHKIVQKILDGFQNAGQQRTFDQYGNSERALSDRPITAVDLRYDPVTRETVERIARDLQALSQKEQASALVDIVNSYFKPRDMTEHQLDEWYNQFNREHAGERVLLGDFIRMGKGVCSQQALLYKLVGDALGLKVSYVRGTGTDSRPNELNHAWNTVKFDETTPEQGIYHRRNPSPRPTPAQEFRSNDLSVVFDVRWLVKGEPAAALDGHRQGIDVVDARHPDIYVGDGGYATVLSDGKRAQIGRSNFDPNQKHWNLVSREHGYVESLDGQLYFTDKGSSNGTFLNGERIPTGVPIIIKPGDILAVGNLNGPKLDLFPDSSITTPIPISARPANEGINATTSSQPASAAGYPPKSFNRINGQEIQTNRKVTIDHDGNVITDNQSTGIDAEYAHYFVNSSGRAFIKDVGSTDGTFINGEMIPAHKWVQIHSDDSVHLGRPGSGHEIDFKPANADPSIRALKQQIEEMRLPKTPLLRPVEALSKEAIDASRQISKENIFSEAIPDGWVDAGQRAEIGSDGTIINSLRHAVAHHREADSVYQAVESYAIEKFGQLPKLERAEAITRFTNDLLNPQHLSTKELDAWHSEFAQEHKREPVLIGEFIRQGKGVCLEQSILTKLLMDAVGLDATIIRGAGLAHKGNFLLNHAWVEVKIDAQSEPLIFDPRQKIMGKPYSEVPSHKRDSDTKPAKQALEKISAATITRPTAMTSPPVATQQPKTLRLNDPESLGNHAREALTAQPGDEPGHTAQRHIFKELILQLRSLKDNGTISHDWIFLPTTVSSAADHAKADGLFINRKTGEIHIIDTTSNAEKATRERMGKSFPKLMTDGVIAYLPELISLGKANGTLKAHISETLQKLATKPSLLTLRDFPLELAADAPPEIQIKQLEKLSADLSRKAKDFQRAGRQQDARELKQYINLMSYGLDHLKLIKSPNLDRHIQEEADRLLMRCAINKLIGEPQPESTTNKSNSVSASMSADQKIIKLEAGDETYNGGNPNDILKESLARLKGNDAFVVSLLRDPEAVNLRLKLESRFPKHSEADLAKEIVRQMVGIINMPRKSPLSEVLVSSLSRGRWQQKVLIEKLQDPARAALALREISYAASKTSKGLDEGLVKAWIDCLAKDQQEQAYNLTDHTEKLIDYLAKHSDAVLLYEESALSRLADPVQRTGALAELDRLADSLIDLKPKTVNAWEEAINQLDKSNPEQAEKHLERYFLYCESQLEGVAAAPAVAHPQSANSPQQIIEQLKLLRESISDGMPDIIEQSNIDRQVANLFSSLKNPPERKSAFYARQAAEALNELSRSHYSFSPNSISETLSTLENLLARVKTESPTNYNVLTKSYKSLLHSTQSDANTISLFRNLLSSEHELPELLAITPSMFSATKLADASVNATKTAAPEAVHPLTETQIHQLAEQGYKHGMSPYAVNAVAQIFKGIDPGKYTTRFGTAEEFAKSIFDLANAGTQIQPAQRQLLQFLYNNEVKSSTMRALRSQASDTNDSKQQILRRMEVLQDSPSEQGARTVKILRQLIEQQETGRLDFVDASGALESPLLISNQLINISGNADICTACTAAKILNETKSTEEITELILRALKSKNEYLNTGVVPIIEGKPQLTAEHIQAVFGDASAISGGADSLDGAREIGKSYIERALFDGNAFRQTFNRESFQLQAPDGMYYLSVDIPVQLKSTRDEMGIGSHAMVAVKRNGKVTYYDPLHDDKPHTELRHNYALDKAYPVSADPLRTPYSVLMKESAVAVKEGTEVMLGRENIGGNNSNIAKQHLRLGVNDLGLYIKHISESQATFVKRDNQLFMLDKNGVFVYDSNGNQRQEITNGNRYQSRPFLIWPTDEIWLGSRPGGNGKKLTLVESTAEPFQEIS